MLAHFRDKVVIYPIGITVKLNSGETAVVVDYDPSYPQRPIVRVLTNEIGEDLTVPYEINLSRELSTMIVKVNDAAL